MKKKVKRSFAGDVVSGSKKPFVTGLPIHKKQSSLVEFIKRIKSEK